MNWKQKILEARTKWYLEKYEAARVFGVPKLAKPYDDSTTNGLTKCVFDWLKYHNHYVNRVNTQGQPRVEKIELSGGGYRTNVKWTHGTTNKGTADIDSIIHGKPVKIEIKCAATKDTLSKDQLKEKVRIEQAGGTYYVATDMATFVSWYKEKFAVKNIA